MVATTAVPGVYLAVEDLLALRGPAQQLNLHKQRPSQAIMGGQGRTRFRGRGMEFAEVRPYQPGDDIRTIDWRVTARTQSPYTKLFQEERERPVLVLVDQRSPMFFGSRYMLKSVYAAQIAAVIGWAAHQVGDRIGGLIVGDSEQNDLRAARGKQGLLRFFSALSEYNRKLTTPLANSENNALVDILQALNRVVRPGSQVFLLSDFHDLNAACAEPLSLMAKHSDVMAIQIYDALEVQLPKRSWLRISNGKQQVTLDTQAVLPGFQQAFYAQQEFLSQMCLNNRIVCAQAPVSASVEPLLQSLFHAKAHQGKAAGEALYG